MKGGDESGEWIVQAELSERGKSTEDDLELAEGGNYVEGEDAGEEREERDTDRDRERNIWFHLPSDIQYHIIDYLISSPDLLGVLEMLTKHGLRPHHYHYHECCKYVYPDQCVKKTLNKDTWGGSWVNMLKNRHRVRMNGFYSLQTSYWKPPNNDAFWEDRRFEFIEVKFHRHIRFMRNGKLLYMLDNNDARDVYTAMKHGTPIQKKIFEGIYTVSKDMVSIQIETHYNVINFIAQIRDADVDCTDSRRRYVGKFNVLRIIEHSDRPLNSSPQNDLQKYVHKLPSNTDMCFYRYWEFDV